MRARHVLGEMGLKAPDHLVLLKCSPKKDRTIYAYQYLLKFFSYKLHSIHDHYEFQAVD